ncbi:MULTISPECIES: hypothetical protein [unclassified Plantibacter]|uniref:hypothetical protein n=1 Tax=unclassified Plantibacter TaxID=2624265 RepID=UPI000AF0857C|nr:MULTISPECIES: hypothetical protein [unclassified Plantibacter]
MTAVDAGRLVGSDYLQQIRDVAAANALADCGIYSRVFQTLIVATNGFEAVAVSELNHRCTGSLEGLGKSSSRFPDGGGEAVSI